MIVAIETSTPVCSVAAGQNGRILQEKRIDGKGVHSTYTFTFLDEIFSRFKCKPDDLEAILFSNGPGSYTGLRIGASAIKGILFGKNVPLFVCSTLQAIGIPHIKNSGKAVHAVLDARRNHLYHQKMMLHENKMLFGQAGIKKISEIEELIQNGDTIAGTGTHRLAGNILTNSEIFGKNHISAINLLNAWYKKPFRTIFSEADPALFEPDYVSVSQINNSPAG